MCDTRAEGAARGTVNLEAPSLVNLEAPSLIRRQGGETGELELDAPVQRVVPMFDAGKLAVVHESSIGYVTFVDMDEASRDTSRSVRGFLLEGLLD